MGRRRDAALALAVLTPTLAAGVALGAPLAADAVVVGAGGALATEWLLARDAARVRARWERPPVQAGAVVVGLALTGIAWTVVGAWALTAVAAGLVAYLALLGVLAGGERAARRRGDG